MIQQTLRCDIFCTVIDNFGDAGVCLRLARQLATEHSWAVRLVIDRPGVLFRLAPELATNDTLGMIIVSPWPTINNADDGSDADIVIEAFACELPTFYVEAMAKRSHPPIWINLEYLTAEPWTAACHGLPSPHPGTGLLKYFFFPGFTAWNGGVPIESDYLHKRAKFCRDRFFSEIGLPNRTPDPPRRVISMFCYDHAPLPRLIEQLAADSIATTLLIPDGKREPTRDRNVIVVPIGFLPQHRFDELLWASDVNFVRGEDSFVRAQLAGKPFVWNVYLQDEGAHLNKLNAFLDIAGLHESPPVVQFFNAWNGNATMDWDTFSAGLPDVEPLFRTWSESIHAQDGLVTRLVQFCVARLK